jgi:hypothetical protein
MKTFCTIITKNYFPFALALYKSIYKFDNATTLQVLVVDATESDEDIDLYPGISFHSVKDIFNYGLTASIYRKYAYINQDNFRWALKPIFISYLLEYGFNKVIYTDCDIYFYNDYHFLFDELDTSSILLTPHWINSDPLKDELSFLSLLRDGIFNAGFIGANTMALPALTWWANVCHYSMDVNPEVKIREDQGYLNLFPVKFEKVNIIRHRGCNVSAWNQIECKRELVNGEVLINGLYPIIFIHFNWMAFQEIMKGHDGLLLPHLNEYRKVFEESGANLSFFHNDFHLYYAPNALFRLKWRMKIRTRVKQLLFLMAKKL